ncbi:hypothetical protein EmuJ_000273900 [Echinococcus multilocularis]|uniref:Uncharacterized protein n=1 Tax=Echinococcus multilocularis TaxID=6211 RepID=A0A068XSV7_ECHMU|nr:hypothetical protein EmuJ_000273900 [Echinococcus multilocularis]
MLPQHCSRWNSEPWLPGNQKPVAATAAWTDQLVQRSWRDESVLLLPDFQGLRSLGSQRWSPGPLLETYGALTDTFLACSPPGDQGNHGLYVVGELSGPLSPPIHRGRGLGKCSYWAKKSLVPLGVCTLHAYLLPWSFLREKGSEPSSMVSPLLSNDGVNFVEQMIPYLPTTLSGPLSKVCDHRSGSGPDPEKAVERLHQGGSPQSSSCCFLGPVPTQNREDGVAAA